MRKELNQNLTKSATAHYDRPVSDLLGRSEREEVGRLLGDLHGKLVRKGAPCRFDDEVQFRGKLWRVLDWQTKVLGSDTFSWYFLVSPDLVTKMSWVPTPEVRKLHTASVDVDFKSRIASWNCFDREMVATDFANQAALDAYLKAHPGADRKKHKVVSPHSSAYREMQELEQRRSVRDQGGPGAKLPRKKPAPNPRSLPQMTTNQRMRYYEPDAIADRLKQEGKGSKHSILRP